MILIFTIEHDISTTNVIKWLDYFEEEVIRMNADDDLHKFEEINSEGIFFRNILTNKVFNLLDAKACWWRRRGISKSCFTDLKKEDTLINGTFDLTSLINGDNNLINKEVNDLIDFIYYQVYKNCKINIGRPTFNVNKLIVNEMAEKHGLRIPAFKIARNNHQIASFNKRNTGLISKAISNGVYNTIGNHRFYSYTELIEDELLEKRKEVNFFPSLIMEKVEKKSEIRTFYLDGQFYSMAIFSQSSDQTKVDFRKYNNKKPNKTEPYKLPKNTEDKLVKLFNELDLNCGSVDLIIDTKGDYIFLEINPVGQYGMVSDPCNYNLDKRIAKYLINGSFKEN
ncbi:grasp-with-spasm system ATP-grasp peptide maturase [Tenacibaculum sp. TC6]|uniref:grasp-with-spasm system ATP-grasp peptide maturase n=1 Tax=Tenacibaculum sp. TC6 TaxID=3423223 RepID=UPI003D3613E9